MIRQSEIQLHILQLIPKDSRRARTQHYKTVSMNAFISALPRCEIPYSTISWPTAPNHCGWTILQKCHIGVTTDVVISSTTNCALTSLCTSLDSCETVWIHCRFPEETSNGLCVERQRALHKFWRTDWATYKPDTAQILT